MEGRSRCRARGSIGSTAAERTQLLCRYVDFIYESFIVYSLCSAFERRADCLTLVATFRAPRMVPSTNLYRAGSRKMRVYTGKEVRTPQEL